MGTNGIAVLDSRGASVDNDRATLEGIKLTPVKRSRIHTRLAGVGGKSNSVGPFASSGLFDNLSGCQSWAGCRRGNGYRGGRLFEANFFLGGDARFNIRKSLADLAVGRIDLINKIEMVLVKRLDGLQNFLKDVLV